MMATHPVEGITPRGRDDIARRVARDIGEGWYVNLGIGMPTLIANYVSPESEIVFHSENGILGMGPSPAPDKIDTWLINAGKQYVTMLPGGSFMHHADSFTIARGGHLDLCVLGAYQVTDSGDLANWATSDKDTAPAVGGAMDLAAGAKRIWVIMTHLSKSGEPKLTRKCTYPLTALGCVKRVYTDYAIIDVTPDGFIATEMVDGMDIDRLRQIVDAPVHLP